MTGGQTITQGPITIFLFQNNFFMLEQKNLLLEQLKIVSEQKKLFRNKFDWITHVGRFVGPV